MYLLPLVSVSATLFPLIIISAHPDASPKYGSSPLVYRQTNDEEAYLDSVCQPNVTDPIPPCQEIINIQSACTPNGTTALAYLAHQECMCGGSFFADWLGCLNCLYLHGGRSQAQSIAFAEILTSASDMLCTGTPTNSFAAIFSSLSDAQIVGASTAGTGMTDRFPSRTAVSLYFTTAGPQGEGAITGSATRATAGPQGEGAITGSATRATAVPSMAAGTSSGGAGGSTAAATTTAAAGGASAGSGGGGSSSVASTSSSSGAAATNGLAGLLGVVAGGVVVAAL